MADRPRAYTIDELERLSGIDRRTIAYYVQEGLLPRIGRRGPRTRYPQLFLDRLLFIKRQRDREEAGQLEGTMTLAEIRGLFEREDAATIAAVVREEPASAPAGEPMMAREAAPLEARFGLRSPAMAPPGVRARRMTEDVATFTTGPRPVEEPPRLSAPPSAEDFAVGQEPIEHELGSFLSRLEAAAGRRRWGPAHRSEHWTHAAITPDISISARNLDENEVYLLEKLADLLRRLLHRRERW